MYKYRLCKGSWSKCGVFYQYQIQQLYIPQADFRCYVYIYLQVSVTPTISHRIRTSAYTMQFLQHVFSQPVECMYMQLQLHSSLFLIAIIDKGCHNISKHCWCLTTYMYVCTLSRHDRMGYIHKRAPFFICTY